MPILLRLPQIALALGAGLLASCSGPANLLSRIPETDWRHPGEPLPPILVELGSDKRPQAQRGLRKSLGDSWLSSDALTEPTDVTLLRSIARDLRTSGLSPGAALRFPSPPLRLRIDILELGVLTSDGVESLAVVLPTTDAELRMQIRAVFTDAAGRCFLDEVFRYSESRTTLPIAGSQGVALGLLARGYRDLIDRMLPRLSGGHGDFWLPFGGPPPPDRGPGG